MNLLIAKFTSTFEGMKARADLNAAKVFARFLRAAFAPGGLLACRARFGILASRYERYGGSLAHTA